ncbi:MAG: hypothetical protein Pars2KO_27280 [Parasphingorhabdus sp.]
MLTHLEILYFAFLLICCGYAIYRGSRIEYAGAAIMVSGSLVTAIVANWVETTWTGLETGIFVVDVIFLFALIHLAIVSDRFWPMWATGFHLLAVAVHTAIMVAPEVTPWAFATGAAFWAYPMLLALAIGAHEYVRPAVRVQNDGS